MARIELEGHQGRYFGRPDAVDGRVVAACRLSCQVNGVGWGVPSGNGFFVEPGDELVLGLGVVLQAGAADDDLLD